MLSKKFFSQEKADEFFKEQSKLINSSKVNGANVRYFNPSSGKTENIIFVSEANALKNRRSQTPIHEITHTILAEAIAKKSHKIFFGPLANGILTSLAENNSALILGRVTSKNTKDKTLKNINCVYRGNSIQVDYLEAE